MAALDWSQCPAVESIPGKVSGAWVFKGTRLPVATVIENLEDLSIDEVMEQFDVTREQITAVLDFVAQSLRTEPVPTGAHPLWQRNAEGTGPRAVWAYDSHSASQRLGHTQQWRALECRRGGTFDLLLTTDRRILIQQNLTARRIALVVLTGSTRWSRVRRHVDRIAHAVAAATAGSYSEVEIPFD
jgi:uncharacterized protein (DUF433 family)